MKSWTDDDPASDKINSLALSSRKMAAWVSVATLLIVFTRVDLKGGEGHLPRLYVNVASEATANLVYR